MKYILFFVVLLLSVVGQGQTRKDLIGCWNMPGLKDEYLSLDSEGNFFFNDWLEYTRSFDQLFGTWKLQGGVLVLTYGEEKQIRFKTGTSGAGGWMLVKTGKVRLYKTRPEDCER